MSASRNLFTVLSAALLGVFSAGNVGAQTAGGSSSSSSSSTEATIKGYAFKYKEKFDTYAEQIDMGVSKGWLTSAQADTFKTRLAQLRITESNASKAGYPAAEVANLDKVTTKFNEDLSTASSKAPATTGSGAASDTKTPSSAKADASSKTVSKKTAVQNSKAKTVTDHP